MSKGLSTPLTLDGSKDLSHLAREIPPETPPSDAETKTRADGLLRWVDEQWQRLERLIHQFLPPGLNPLNQLGAIANTCLLIAVLSGVALLIWYAPSVHQAHESLEKLRSGSPTGRLVRSIHRYSSDACLLFVLLHAFRILTQRRFTGARWLPWTTGVALLALLWFVGWTGYWLVWDVRAQHAALGTARFLDNIPIFTEPLSRSFLTDKSVPSLFFFLIFFIHMLTPLAMGIGLWIHLARVNRARFLATKHMTLWICATLVALSLLAPAFSAAPAQMTLKATAFTIDGWFLWPLVLTDRLTGGALWAIFGFGGLAALTIPWTMARRATAGAKAEVELPRCIGCGLCAKDCPFNAITMIPREDGRKFEVQSSVDPALCVSCGICTGACDSQAINLPRLNSREVERRLVEWIEGRVARREPAFIAFCCGESAGSYLKPDREGLSELMPGYRIQTVPCVGWVSAVMIERLVQRGARGVLVIGCGEGEPVAREGQKWFADRLEGVREPKLDTRKADLSCVRHVRFNRAQRNLLLEAAQAFRIGLEQERAKFTPLRKLLVGSLLAVGLAGATYLVSDLPYSPAHSPEPELVVSFNHAGAILEAKQLSKEELAKRLPHMRAQINVSRERAPVRMRVLVDGAVAYEDTFAPRGFSKDGPSIALVRLPMKEGKHQIRVEIADSVDATQWTRSWSEVVSFERNRNRVVLFDLKSGFTLH